MIKLFGILLTCQGIGGHYMSLYYQPKQCMVIPVVPHKAVAEVSRIGHYRRD